MTLTSPFSLVMITRTERLPEAAVGTERRRPVRAWSATRMQVRAAGPVYLPECAALLEGSVVRPCCGRRFRWPVQHVRTARLPVLRAMQAARQTHISLPLVPLFQHLTNRLAVRGAEALPSDSATWDPHAELRNGSRGQK